MGANFGIAGVDWQQRVNWDRLRKYRTERAREMMKKHGLGALLCMYDENVRYLTGTLTPGWNRLKPGLRYAMLCGDGAPILFEQGDLGFQIERHSPWIPKTCATRSPGSKARPARPRPSRSASSPRRCCRR
jgi:Xaa-Pro dipeptidase